MQMNWRNLYFGHVTLQEVQEAVKDPEWQTLRRSLKGLSLQDKYNRLWDYYQWHYRRYCKGQSPLVGLKMVEVRITNYVTALSRSGLIKPSDYKKEGNTL